MNEIWTQWWTIFSIAEVSQLPRTMWKRKSKDLVSRMLERIYYVQSVQYHPIPDTASIAKKFSQEVQAGVFVGKDVTNAHWMAEKFTKHHRSTLAHRKYHLLECQKNLLGIYKWGAEKLARKLTTGMLSKLTNKLPAGMSVKFTKWCALLGLLNTSVRTAASWRGGYSLAATA